MPNFVYNNTTLPIDKINAGPLPPGANPRQWAVAAEWISVLQALLDVQGFCRGAQWMGFASNAADPEPAGIARYVWIRTDGAVMKTIDGVASEIGAGGAVGIIVADEDVNITNTPHTRLDFAGAGVMVTDAGGGTALVTIPGGGGISGIDIADEGSDIPNTPHTRLDFAGSGVTVTDAGGGSALVTIPGGGGGSGVALDYQPPSPNGPPSQIQFNTLNVHPDGSKVYVGGSAAANDVWRVLTATNKWDPATPLSTGPLGVVEFFAFNADGSKMYVSRSDNYFNVHVVDTATNTIIGTVSGLLVGSNQAMALHPTNGELWIHGGDGTTMQIARVNTTTDTVIGTFPVGVNQVWGMVFNAAGTKVYLGSLQDVFTGQVKVFDAVTYLELADFDFPNSEVVNCLVALPDNSEVWAGKQGTFPNPAEIIRISVASNTIVGSPIPTSGEQNGPWALKCLPDSSKVYAFVQTGFSAGFVDVIDVTSHAVTSTIALGASYSGDLALTPSGAYLYASQPLETPPAIKVINTSTNLVVDTITREDISVPAPVNVGTFDTLQVEGGRLTDEGGGAVQFHPPIVFDVGATPYQNLKANRTGVNATQNDQTKTGITNLGSASDARGDFATIGGGQTNVASGLNSTVDGGTGNTASGESSAVGGGTNNRVAAFAGVISGGGDNQITDANDYASAIGGGDGNTIDSDYAAVITGGAYNVIDVNAYQSAIVGGGSNIVAGDNAFIGGGENNQANNSYGVIAGGSDNRVQGFYSAVLGGGSNNVYSDFSGIVSGDNNWIGFSDPNQADNFIGAGRANSIDGEHSGIVAGQNNIINDDILGVDECFIGAGNGNQIEQALRSSIVGGFINELHAADMSAIGGGRQNDLLGHYSVIGGGDGNQITDDWACIPGGRENAVNELGGFALGFQNLVPAGGFNAMALGFKARAYNESQLAFASGDGIGEAAGRFQVSWLVGRGVGVGGGGVAALSFGQTYGSITLRDNFAYAVRVRAIASGGTGVQVVEIIQEIVVVNIAGTATIAEQVQTLVRGTATAKANWTVTGSVATNQLSINFSTNADTATLNVFVAAHCEFVETRI